MLFPQVSQVIVLIRYFVFSPLHFSKFIGKKCVRVYLSFYSAVSSVFRVLTVSLLTIPTVRGRRPDRAFCGNEVAHALGLSVPGDLSVVGFNNVPPANWRSFKLTTIEYPIGQTIDTIVDLLDKHLAYPGRLSEVRRIPTRLIVRATTRQIPPGA